MDDIEKVIQQARNIQFSEKHEHLYANRLSDLPASKDAMKQSLKGRIRLLCGAYISLASYVHDEDFKLLITGSQRQKRKVYKRVLKEVERNREEIKVFDPLD